jgi:hypothetical protein
VWLGVSVGRLGTPPPPPLESRLLRRFGVRAQLSLLPAAPWPHNPPLCCLVTMGRIQAPPSTLGRPHGVVGVSGAEGLASERLAYLT